jgi:hypothetical protein
MLYSKDEHGLRETTWSGLQTLDFLALKISGGQNLRLSIMHDLTHPLSLNIIRQSIVRERNQESFALNAARTLSAS